MDCMEYLATCEDNAFELAIIDPPYGIGVGKMKLGEGCGTKSRTWTKKNWDDVAPQKEYFDELMRASKNCIIWGGNYFAEYLPSFPCALIWDKISRGYGGCDFELAFTTFNSASKALNISRVEAYTRLNKIHPTPEP